jgi:hypothetical protein
MREQDGWPQGGYQRRTGPQGDYHRQHAGKAIGKAYQAPPDPFQVYTSVG